MKRRGLAGKVGAEDGFVSGEQLVCRREGAEEVQEVGKQEGGSQSLQVEVGSRHCHCSRFEGTLAHLYHELQLQHHMPDCDVVWFCSHLSLNGP
jgi:hypothetical protein